MSLRPIILAMSWADIENVKQQLDILCGHQFQDQNALPPLVSSLCSWVVASLGTHRCLLPLLLKGRIPLLSNVLNLWDLRSHSTNLIMELFRFKLWLVPALSNNGTGLDADFLTASAACLPFHHTFNTSETDMIPCPPNFHLSLNTQLHTPLKSLCYLPPDKTVCSLLIAHQSHCRCFMRTKPGPICRHSAACRWVLFCSNVPSRVGSEAPLLTSPLRTFSVDQRLWRHLCS